MGERVGVAAQDARYRVAAAELPRRTLEVARLAGAVVVIDGHGDWMPRAGAAVEAGACALVVVDPAPVHDSAGLDRIAGAIPVVLDRPRVRPDVAADLAGVVQRQMPIAAVAECVAPAGGESTVLLDALAWLRQCAGAPLDLSASRSTRHGVLAQLGPARGSGVGSMALSVLVTGLASGLDGATIRVSTLGVERAELVVDDAAGFCEVRAEEASGVRIAPRRFESAQRVALRRAVDAVESGERPRDLPDFVHDVALLRSITNTL